MRNFWIAVSIATGLATAVCGQDAKSLTYDQALEMTLTRNPELKAASYEQEAALRERKAAYGLRLPQASVTGTYVYMGDDMSVGMNDLKGPVGGILGSLPEGLLPPAVLQQAQALLAKDWAMKLQDRSFGTVAANITVPVYTGGKINAANNAAKIKVENAAQKETQARNGLVSELTERYYGLALAMQVVEVRKQVLDGMDIKQTVLNMLRSSIESQVAFAFGEHDKTDDEHRADALKSCEGTYFPRGAVDANSLSGLSADDLTDRFYEAAEKYYEAKEAAVTSPIMRELERVVLLRVVDEYWMDHIDAMSELRQAIRLQSYGNNKPIDVYKQESLTMFEDMISAIQGDTVRRIFSARVKTEGEVKRERVADGIVASTSGDGTVKKQPRKVQKIGRNDPCPCGSGKKYKQCCGR